MRESSVLFLDDEENILSAVRRLFAGEEVGVITTTNPAEALMILSQQKIKVVASDERMPVMSGVDFLREVKERYPDIVRILFTGYADTATAENAINLSEVSRIINKPWNSQELKRTIEQALEHYDLVVQNRNLFESTRLKNNELETLNQKLQTMFEMQKDFTSTVSHELRTPLASIRTALDIVVSQTPGHVNLAQMNFLSIAKDNVDRLSRLINDVLDLSKMESGRAHLNFEMKEMNQIILDAAEAHMSVAKDKGLELTTQLALGLPLVHMDVDKVHQIFDNLLGNAIKFTEKGGITIRSIEHEDTNHIEVCVEDTGMGIKAEDIPKLFHKFQQLGHPAARITSGTGLGLAICQEIVRQHGGKIWVTSEFGSGSTFHFLLPVRDHRKDQ